MWLVDPQSMEGSGFEPPEVTIHCEGARILQKLLPNYVSHGEGALCHSMLAICTGLRWAHQS